MATDNAESLPQQQDPAEPAERRGLLRRVGLALLHSREASIAIAGIVLVIYSRARRRHSCRQAT